MAAAGLALFFTVLAAPLIAAEETAPKPVNWAEIRPLDFLNMLRDNKGSVMMVECLNEPPAGWIKTEDIGELMPLIDSREEAAPVISELSTYMPPPKSTVGNEAMFLIEGYRARRYPPTPCSVSGFEADPEQYRNWYETFRTGERTTIGAGPVKIISHGPTREEVLNDTKPAKLPVIDALFLREDEIVMGASRSRVLVNRITNVVEYVWSWPYKCYVRPKYAMPNVQELYNRTHLQ